jgi:hypothetical protein
MPSEMPSILSPANQQFTNTFFIAIAKHNFAVPTNRKKLV